MLSRAPWRRHERRCRASLRPLRRPLRAGDADPRARRARACVGRGARRRGLPRRARRPAARLRGPAHAALPGSPYLRGGRPPRVPQARGPPPHRRAQDQQRARPGATRQAHGEEADHRGDRRRPARRCRRDGVRPPRARLRRVHGHRGHAPPASQRRAHEPARREGRAGRVGRAHAQGGRERGDQGLGRQRGRDALHHRLRRGPLAVPVARARPPARDRRRGTRAGARRRRPPPRPRARLRRRRLQRDRHVRRIRERCGRGARGR